MMSQMREVRSTMLLRCLPGKPAEVGVKKFGVNQLICHSSHQVYLKLPQRVGSVVGETLMKELIIMYRAL